MSSQSARQYRTAVRPGRIRREESKCRRSAAPLERLEERQLLSVQAAVAQATALCCPVADTVEYRSITGAGNNQANSSCGAAGTDFIRVSPAAYRVTAADPNGFFTPSMNGGAPFFVAGSRLVSNDVANQATTLFGPNDVATVNQNGLSGFSYVFGQFVDHDMDLTVDDGLNDFPIPADPTHPGDPIGSLAFSRSIFDPNTGTTSPRQQINTDTAYLDLSQIYGSSDAVAAALRTFKNGQLKTSPGADGRIGTCDDLLPYNCSPYFAADQIAALHMANDAHLVDSTALFAAGDVRANETTDLIAMTTLFVRNHNLIARQLQQQHRNWTDEKIYQEARRLNIAEYQAIIYNEFLPSLLGKNAIPKYTGYDPTVDAGIANEFATVGYRFGHSLLDGDVGRDGNNGADISDPTGDASISLAESFFNPTLVNGKGVIDPATGHVSSDIGPILKAAADDAAQALDVMGVSQLRNLLFGQGGPGQDLIARDLWRAHDHGIGTYNQVRVAYGLAPITDDATHGFDQITSDPAVQALLEQAYTGPTREAFLANGKFAGDIDPFIAGLAEDHAPGSSMGPLFTAILTEQFTRLRDGDRFFYQSQQFDPQERAMLRQGSSLSQVIQANTPIWNLQDDVFHFQASISGRVTGGIRGLSGVIVKLTNSAGLVLATTTTDAQGRYSFNQFSGPSADATVKSGVSGTGTYRLVIVPPAGYQQVGRDTGDLAIKVGGTDLRNVNYVVLPMK